MRTIIVCLVLLLSACSTPSNAGYRIFSLHSPSRVSNLSYVMCGATRAQFRVDVSADKIRTLHIGDACPSGRRR